MWCHVLETSTPCWHHCKTPVTPLSNHCYTIVGPAHSWIGGARDAMCEGPKWQPCHPEVHWEGTTVTPLWHRCSTTVTPLWHHGKTTLKLLWCHAMCTRSERQLCHPEVHREGEKCACLHVFPCMSVWVCVWMCVCVSMCACGCMCVCVCVCERPEWQPCDPEVHWEDFTCETRCALFDICFFHSCTIDIKNVPVNLENLWNCSITGGSVLDKSRTFACYNRRSTFLRDYFCHKPYFPAS
jgi:hypothetical protein